MSVRAFALAFAIALFSASSAFAQRSNCDVFVRHGLLTHFREVTGSFDETHIRQAIEDAYQRVQQSGTSASGGVSIGPFGGTGSYSRQELDAIRKFFASNFESSASARSNAETVSTYVPPQAYDAAKECWRLESDRNLKMDLTWDEEELDEFTLSLSFGATGVTNPVELRGVDVDRSAGIACSGALTTESSLTNVAKDVTCRRNLAAPGTRINAQGRKVRAQSSLVVVKTGAGSIAIQMPEIPEAVASADAIPVGTVIDWWMTPNATVPFGFQVCNGDPITTAGSPLIGQRTPNLIDKFVMGVAPTRVGETGGRPDIPSGGQHNHGGAATTLTYRPGEINWDRGPGRQDQFSHGHAIANDGDHNHGGENRPPYFGLVKLMKVLPSAASIPSTATATR